MLSFFPRGVLDEILNLIESVSEGFPSYSCVTFVNISVHVISIYIITSICFGVYIMFLEGHLLDRMLF